MIEGIEGILRNHAERYSQMQIADVYKLLHQAAMGNRHDITSKRSAGLLLSRELHSSFLAELYGPLDVISGDGNVLRVHLRKYAAERMDVNALLDAFVATANLFKGDSQKLEESLSVALDLSKKKKLPFKPKEMEEYFRMRAEENYPAVHHSNAYVTAYNPSYRVVAKAFLPKAF